MILILNSELELDTSAASTTYAPLIKATFEKVGALSVGSIVNGFTSIDMTGAITTTGKVTSGSADLGTIRISGSQREQALT